MTCGIVNDRCSPGFGGDCLPHTEFSLPISCPISFRWLQDGYDLPHVAKENRDFSFECRCILVARRISLRIKTLGWFL